MEKTSNTQHPKNKEAQIISKPVKTGPGQEDKGQRPGYYEESQMIKCILKVLKEQEKVTETLQYEK